MGGNPLNYIDLLGLDFFGKCLAQSYLDKYGKDAWWKAVADRGQLKEEIFPGTPAEALRNAEHYLYSYTSVNEESHAWGPAIVNTIGYHVVKFWSNVADYHGIVNSPFKRSWPTNDELKAGTEGANDALFGNAEKSICGCGSQ